MVVARVGAACDEGFARMEDAGGGWYVNRRISPVG
jgi:hypothetical protein